MISGMDVYGLDEVDLEPCLTYACQLGSQTSVSTDLLNALFCEKASSMKEVKSSIHCFPEDTSVSGNRLI